jgi:hypothetical protein
MSLVLANVENEVKRRARILGAFAAGESASRMRDSIQFALMEIWSLEDWDFKNSTKQITTSQGNLGPYAAPSGLVRFATTQKRAFFGYRDAETLVPIQSTDSQEFKPYLFVQDGAIYFIEDPGDSTLTLNYLGQPTDSIEDPALTAFLALFPTGLKNAITTITLADLIRDLPGMTDHSDKNEKRGRTYAEEYWEDSTRGTVQTQIAPKGLGGQQLDGMLRQINVLGDLSVRFVQGSAL